MRFLFIVTALISVVLSCSIAWAQALRFQPQGAAAAGQGNAFAAQADDASAIQYNPAALSQLQGVQIYAGAVAMGGSIKYQSPAGVGTTGDFGGAVVYPPPSHFYISANLGAVGLPGLSSVTLGLGVNNPFGLNTRYP